MRRYNSWTNFDSNPSESFDFEVSTKPFEHTPQSPLPEALRAGVRGGLCQIRHMNHSSDGGKPSDEVEDF